jgi:hypothetical protein
MVIYKVVGYRHVGRRRRRVVRWAPDEGLANKVKEKLEEDGFLAESHRVEAPTRNKPELIEWLNVNAAE